jgi:hypothetical protein
MEYNKSDIYPLYLDDGDLWKLCLQHLASKPDVPVVWQHLDATLVFYPDQFVVHTRLGLLVMELTLATDQTGADKLIIPYALGKNLGQAALFAVTPHAPTGHPLLVARWGRIVQQALWQTLLQVGQSMTKHRVAIKSPVLAGMYRDERGFAFVLSRPVDDKEIDPLLKKHRIG